MNTHAHTDMHSYTHVYPLCAWHTPVLDLLSALTTISYLDVQIFVYLFLSWFPCQNISFTRTGTLFSSLFPPLYLTIIAVDMNFLKEWPRSPIWSHAHLPRLAEFFFAFVSLRIFVGSWHPVEDGVWGFDSESQLNNNYYHLLPF